jgi:hypothetical protein
MKKRAPKKTRNLLVLDMILTKRSVKFRHKNDRRSKDKRKDPCIHDD